VHGCPDTTTIRLGRGLYFGTGAAVTGFGLPGPNPPAARAAHRANGMTTACLTATPL
jgi:hypothetical protein